jgi:hypothetical protein
LINSASALTLDRFIRIIVEGDFSVLILSGTPSERELREAWEKIYNEYLSLTKNKEQLYIYSLQKDILLLEFKLVQINSCIAYLVTEKDEEVLRELRKVLYLYGKFDPSDPEGYVRDLQAVASNAQRFVIERDEKIKELDGLLKDAPEKANEGTFEDLIIRISKYMGFRVDRTIVTVSEFASMIKDYNAYAAEIEKTYAR